MVKRLFLVIAVTLCMVAGAYGQEEADGEDAEVIEMLDLLDYMELLDDKDFELLEDVTRMGEPDGS